MVNINLKRRLIARTLGVGVDRVWIDPQHLDEVADIDTREDVKILIRKGYIKIKEIEGQTVRRKEGKRGPGSRKGKRTARTSKKELWIMRIRAQRKLLRELRDKGVITRKQYRKLYMLAKGGMFKSKAHLRSYIHEMLKAAR